MYKGFFNFEPNIILQQQNVKNKAENILLEQNE